MARKIAVVGSPEHLKKSVAHLLVRRLLAVWVVENVSIRRLAISEIPREARSIKIIQPSKPYIPEKLPPVDIPGIKFIEPQSEQWRREHRTVKFLPRQGEEGEHHTYHPQTQ